MDDSNLQQAELLSVFIAILRKSTRNLQVEKNTINRLKSQHFTKSFMKLNNWHTINFFHCHHQHCSGQTDRIVQQACTQVSLIEHLLNRLPQAPQVP